MGLLDRLKRKKEDEASRITRLLQSGRIVDGKVIDVATDADGKIVQVYYSYDVSGVQYESSQLLSPEQQQSKNKYIPGASLTVRYDPRRPANSIVP